MGIVRFALRFPHTFYVVAALILFLGFAAIRSMPTDIFPEINIPVVSVVWTYNGMSAEQIQDRILAIHERQMASLVDDISRIEATSYNGVGVEKVGGDPTVLAVVEGLVGVHEHVVVVFEHAHELDVTGGVPGDEPFEELDEPGTPVSHDGAVLGVAITGGRLDGLAEMPIANPIEVEATDHVESLGHAVLPRG